MMRVLASLLLLVCTVESTGYVPVYPKLPQCECTQLDLSVIGYVFDGDANGPGVAGVPVVVGGNQLTTTDDKGFYRIVVPNTGRIPIRFEADSPFTPVTKILNIPEDYTGEVRFDVILVRGKVTKIDATIPNVLVIPLACDVSFEIPANNFKNPKTGQLVDCVLVTVTAWSPDNEDDATTVPGDFCTVDENGNKRGLFTLGVFSLSFTDENGNEVEVFQGCFVNLPKNPYEYELGSPLLWGFNDVTGLWEENAPFVKDGDNFTAQVQPIERLFFNIDWEFDFCSIKVKAYFSDFFLSREAGVTIQLYQYVRGNDDWVFSNFATTGRDGVCMTVLCCAIKDCGKLSVNLRARITATEAGRQYFADSQFDNNAEDDFTIDHSTYISNGWPVYPSTESCEAGDLHFRFFKKKEVI